MSKEEKGEKPKKTTPASDSETAAFLIAHIENPCEVEVAPGFRENLRDFYIREAERILPTMKNKDAIIALKHKVEEYKKR